MKKKLTILGCGSSLGSPWITNYKGNLNNNPKNIRSRCCAHIQYGNISIAIDTSPDIKNQFLKNKIKSLDAIIYTHEHADQTAGIFEMRPFFWKNEKKIPVFGSARTIKALKKTHTYCFYERFGYKPIMQAKVVKNRFNIQKKKQKLSIIPFDVIHGLIKATGYFFEKIAYLSDCNKVPKKSLKYLFNLDYLILDCLKFRKHPSHFNYDDALELVKIVNPRKTILTNLHTDIDYDVLKKKLPKHVVPAYDGMSFNF